jgi:hypothetical protein
MLDEPLVYSTSRSKHLFGLAGCVGFVLIGLWILSPGMEDEVRLFEVVAAYSGIIFLDWEFHFSCSVSS